MPFRCLSYVTELLNNLVKNKNRLYYKGLIKFPKPKFFVLYNGDKNEPLQRKMRLSDAFDGYSTSLELVVTVFNINFVLSQPLLQKCQYLSDYSILVGKVKEVIKLGLSRRYAISRAVKFSLDNGIMGNYLVEHSEEVFNMLALEWNLDDALQARFEEGHDEGIEEVAVNMIRDGEPLDKILKFTKLSLESIKELAKNVENN